VAVCPHLQAGASSGFDIGFLDHTPPLDEIGLDLVDGLRRTQEFRNATGGVELLLKILVLARIRQRLAQA
jgi:hypothetical protein